jgi:hypothetical protein
MTYFQISNVYGIDQEYYGYLGGIGSVSLLVGVIIYHRYLTGFEMRTLQYANAILSLLTLGVDLLQVFRFNVKWGISDFIVLCFGSGVFGSL